MPENIEKNRSSILKDLEDALIAHKDDGIHSVFDEYKLIFQISHKQH